MWSDILFICIKKKHKYHFEILFQTISHPLAHEINLKKMSYSTTMLFYLMKQ